MKLFISIFLLLSTITLQAKELEPIRLQLQWKHQFEFAGFYAAKERGFYSEAGLDVTFLEQQSNKAITDTVLDNGAEYGLVYSSLLAEIYNGAPLVFLANFFKQSPIVLIAQKNIQNPSDLIGKKIMGISDAIDSLTLLEMFRKFKINRSDYIDVATTYSIKPFTEKKVDAMSVFLTNELYTLNKLGIEYNVFDPTVYGIKYYDLNLFTTQKELQEHPLRVKAFRNASIRGWAYALSHKDEIVKLILEKYNSQNKDYDALMYEARQIESIMLRKVYPIGSIDKQRVKGIIDSFKQAGFIDKNSYKNLDDIIYSPAKEQFFLSKEEKEYLKRKKEIRVCSDPYWMPLEGYVDGKYSGLNADVLSVFQEKFQLPLHYVQTQSWADSLQKIEDGSCDMLSLATQTLQRRESLFFTESYLALPLTILTRKETRSVVDIHHLEDVKVAITNGYGYKELLQKHYANLQIIQVANKEEGIQKVLDGEVFGYVESSVVLEYYFKDHDFDALKYNVQFDEKLQFSIAVQKSQPLLFSIMQKGVDSFPKVQREKIFKKWFYVRYKKVINYTIVYGLVLFVLVLLLFMYYKQSLSKRVQKRLKIEIQEAVTESENKSKMMYHQSKLVSMGEMIENIAHQWRQPLSQVNSAVLILDDIASDKEIQSELFEEKLLEIETLTAYMSKTISDFKDFYEQNKTQELFCVATMLNESIEIVQGVLQKHNILLEIHGDIDKEYLGLKNELKQVIVIILNNAKDAFILNEIAKPKINIDIEYSQGEFIIAICDNAGGIKVEQEEKIFEPYFTTKHKMHGTGLGLYIAKMIIEESMSGHLHYSALNAGSCFTIKLKEKDAKETL